METGAWTQVQKVWRRLTARHGLGSARHAAPRWKSLSPFRLRSAPGSRWDFERQAGELLEMLYETSAAFLLVSGRDGKVLAANRAFAAALGRSPEEIAGLYPWDLYDLKETELAEARERSAAIASLACAEARRRYGGKLVRRIRAPAGGLQWIEWTFTYAAAPDGKVDYFMSIGTDVTDRTRAEAALRASEARLAEAQQLAQIGSWERNLGSGKLVWSEELYRILELDPAHTAPGLATYLKVVHPGEREAVRAAHTSAAASALPVDEVRRLLMADGRVKVVRDRWRVVFGADGAPLRLTGTLQDITEQWHKDAQHARMAAAVEHSGDGLVIADRRGVIEYVNPAFETVSGYSRSEAVGAYTRLQRSGKQSPEFYRDLWNTLLSGRVWRGRYVNRRKDGRLWTVDSTMAPIRDGAGEITHFVAVYRDVTESIQMEERLRRTARMEAIGALAGGIAHDLNNLLTPVLGYAELLQAEVSSDSGLSGLVEPIVLAARRARDLIARIMLFSRRADTPLATISPVPVVQETLALLQPTVPATVRIRHSVAADLGWIHADPTHLHEVLMNLCINAAQAMPEGGTLTLTVDNAELRGHLCYMGKLVTGSFVRIAVSDTGTGMTEEVIARVFEPFFSTKETGKGTGLGLSTVFGIVQEWEGELDVRSRPGSGSTFTIYIPRVAPDSAQPAPASAAPAGGTESLLVVDDDPAVAAVVQKILEAAGYRVRAFVSPAAALDALRAAPRDFDLVVSDYIMPGMMGDLFARAVREIRPDLPIVLCTGASEQLPAGDMAGMGIHELVRKPVATHDLLHVVRVALWRGATGAPQ
jgi:PAS domain S-box-containing protein